MSTDRKSFSEIFDEMLPYYLFIGMTDEQYWEHSSYLVVAYRKAHDMKIESRSQEMWLQGLYFYNALGACLSGMFSKGNNNKGYLEKPIRITPMTKEEKEAEAERARKEFIDYLNQWKADFDKQRGE